MKRTSAMRTTIALLGVLLWLAAPAGRRTWRVQKDGSGDFTTIQPAVDAAAAGDTIQIGPGRFTEKAPFTCPGWTEDVCVAVTKSRLVMIGAGRDQTIIGPAVRDYPVGRLPKCIASVYTTGFRLMGCSLENLREGLCYEQGALHVSDCTFRGCDSGVIAYADGGMDVRDCRFIGNTNAGIVTIGPAQNIVVESCEFADNESGASFNNGTTNAGVESCTFNGGRVGVQFAVSTSGSATNCRFTDILNVAIVADIASSVVITNNVVSGGAGQLHVSGNSDVSGTGNVFNGGSYATIGVSCRNTVSLHGNHILKGTGYSVLVFACEIPDFQIDLSDNYWGTADSTTIAGWILDANDHAGRHGFVTFTPFSGQPMPAESKSWGGVKQLFR